MQHSLITEHQNEQMTFDTRHRKTTAVVQFHLLLIRKTNGGWENYVKVNHDEFTVHTHQ